MAVLQHETGPPSDIFMTAQPAQTGDHKVSVRGRFVHIARLQDEWYEDVESPAAVAAQLRKSNCQADVLNFWQRLPAVTPQHDYPMTLDSIAAVPITDYKTWWEKQIDAKTRNMVRRAEKKGVVIRRAELDDTFARGMAGLFNETPVRQGKAFWHYGKDAETIKREFSRFLFREEIFGAYLGEELIGFIFIADAGRFGVLGQIISKIAHRDKAPNNALIAKAVERCAERGFPFLVYAKWVEGSLGEFKRSNGFQRFDMPRYFVPLTLKGKLYVALRLYRGLHGFVPVPLQEKLRAVRSKLNTLRARRKLASS
jgi:hypothetical protein